MARSLTPTEKRVRSADAEGDLNEETLGFWRDALGSANTNFTALTIIRRLANEVSRRRDQDVKRQLELPRMVPRSREFSRNPTNAVEIGEAVGGAPYWYLLQEVIYNCELQGVHWVERRLERTEAVYPESFGDTDIARMLHHQAKAARLLNQLLVRLGADLLKPKKEKK